MSLNEKQKRFCEEYVTDTNGTQAAIRAGYSEKTAYSIGFDLLKKPEIKEVIKNHREMTTEKTQITFEWKLDKLRNVVDVTSAMVQDRLGNPKMSDAKTLIAALAELNKMQGHYAPSNVNLTDKGKTHEEWIELIQF